MGDHAWDFGTRLWRFSPKAAPLWRQNQLAGGWWRQNIHRVGQFSNSFLGPDHGKLLATPTQYRPPRTVLTGVQSFEGFGAYDSFLDHSISVELGDWRI